MFYVPDVRITHAKTTLNTISVSWLSGENLIEEIGDTAHAIFLSDNEQNLLALRFICQSRTMIFFCTHTKNKF